MLVLPLTVPIQADDGTRFEASVHGREREDGLWEGWLEFSAVGKQLVLRTDRETAQSTYDDLAYWASGLEAIYLEGAFARAQAHTPAAAPVDPRVRHGRR